MYKELPSVVTTDVIITHVEGMRLCALHMNIILLCTCWAQSCTEGMCGEMRLNSKNIIIHHPSRFELPPYKVTMLPQREHPREHPREIPSVHHSNILILTMLIRSRVTSYQSHTAFNCCVYYFTSACSVCSVMNVTDIIFSYSVTHNGLFIKITHFTCVLLHVFSATEIAINLRVFAVISILVVGLY